jgi:hypothetical protein
VVVSKTKTTESQAIPRKRRSVTITYDEQGKPDSSGMRKRDGATQDVHGRIKGNVASGFLDDDWRQQRFFRCGGRADPRSGVASAALPCHSDRDTCCTKRYSVITNRLLS